VNVVVTAPPLGVTDEGEKLHVLFAGRPEQLNITTLLNPFCGVTLRVAVPVIPATMLKAEGFAVRVKVGGGGGKSTPCSVRMFEVLGVKLESPE